MNYILETVGLTHQGFLKLRDKYFEWQENTQNDENDVNDNDNDNENDIGDKNDDAILPNHYDVLLPNFDSELK